MALHIVTHPDTGVTRTIHAFALARHLAEGWVETRPAATKPARPPRKTETESAPDAAAAANPEE